MSCHVTYLDATCRSVYNTVISVKVGAQKPTFGDLRAASGKWLL